MLSQNVHPKIVQEMLGHSTITLTLDTYSHVIPTMQGGSRRTRIPSFAATDEAA